MKLKHIDEYKLNYCTLCHGLKENFGLWATLLLNYECTFLYIFLTALYPNLLFENVTFRCPVNPTKKHESKVNDDILEYASFINYHLAVLKAYDGCQDAKRIKKLKYKITFWLLSNNKKYNQLRVKYLEVVNKTDVLCKELYVLETPNCNDYDSCSVKMGEVLYVIVDNFLQSHPVENSREILSFAKHLGMWTYLIDAYDDFDDDLKHNEFNPLNVLGLKYGSENCMEMGLQSGEMMLAMMTINMIKLIKSISLYRHKEVIDNIISYGTRNAGYVIKNKREKKKNECGCKR